MPNKKVLIISYYWPPEGGIGVLRCLKIAKYLRAYGWEPIVFTADKKFYDYYDESNLKDIPEGMLILKHKIWEPYSIYKWFIGRKPKDKLENVFYVKEKRKSLFKTFAIWIRGNFFIPDARASWVKPSVNYLVNYLKENPVDAIFSSGPPHSNTRIATLVKKKTGIPWMADFRDPWTQVDYLKLFKLTKWAAKKHHNQEQEVFTFSDRISIVSDSWREDLMKIGAKSCVTIPIGFDPSDFANLKLTADPNCVLTHIGILGYDRIPFTLLECMKELASENTYFREKFKLKLVGSVDEQLSREAERLGITDLVHLTGNLKREEAIKIAGESSSLLLLLNQQENAKGRIPAKIFEYLALRKSVLALGMEGSDISKILTESKAGINLTYSDHDNIKKYLIQLVNAHENGEHKSEIDSDIEQFNVINLVGKIAKNLEEISTV